jgi:putative nucleotidyltransferase with HDIG domain
MDAKPRYPDREQCLAIMNEHGMLPNIISHSLQVMNVSLAIAGRLDHHTSVDRELIIASALLHDITKTRSILTGESRHDLSGGRVLRDMGFPAIAEIVESHVVFVNFNEQGPLEEREIVYYADKRVMHDSIVSIDERVSDLVNRYGTDEAIKKMILENRNFVLRLEKKIRSRMITDIEAALADAGLIEP